ncbi:hypothetical protein [Endozoicomonas numazuensis]|uniref:hypothetical protein n=1 Tax=Endozoicomonas numazuensis TaxID=1137799 RepID=UPI0012692760|nr:hypothetical protein [Endozoicomonas numazuensis]
MKKPSPCRDTKHYFSGAWQNGSSGRNAGVALFSLVLAMTALPLSAKERITDHEKLAEALSVNDLPSGYVNLEHGQVMKRIGSTSYEKWSFSVSFKEHYGINNRKGAIKASNATELMLEEKDGSPLLRRLYNNFTSKSGQGTNFLRTLPELYFLGEEAGAGTGAGVGVMPIILASSAAGR